MSATPPPNARWTDDATAQFLEAAADDLQRQFGIAGAVRGVTAKGTATAVTLVACVRVGQRETEIRGTGDSLISAYADLRRRPPEAILAAAYRELVEPIR